MCVQLKVFNSAVSSRMEDAGNIYGVISTFIDWTTAAANERERDKNVGQTCVSSENVGQTCVSSLHQKKSHSLFTFLKKTHDISFDKAYREYMLVPVSKHKVFFYQFNQDRLVNCVNFIFYSHTGTGKDCSRVYRGLKWKVSKLYSCEWRAQPNRAFHGGSVMVWAADQSHRENTTDSSWWKPECISLHPWNSYPSSCPLYNQTH